MEIKTLIMYLSQNKSLEKHPHSDFSKPHKYSKLALGPFSDGPTFQSKAL